MSSVFLRQNRQEGEEGSEAMTGKRGDIKKEMT